MKIIHRAILGIIITAVWVGSAVAMDMEALDRVAVLMPKDQVQALIGSPDETIYVGDLDIGLYPFRNDSVMAGTACIYENRERLVGQIFFFNGKAEKTAVERMIKNGFTLLETGRAATTLTGKEDDSDRLLLTSIFEDSGMTMVMSFEKGFYDRQIGQAGKKK
jgi:hypothetical protein